MSAFLNCTTYVQEEHVPQWGGNRWKGRFSGHTVRYTKLILLVDAKYHSCPYNPPDPLRMVRIGCVRGNIGKGTVRRKRWNGHQQG